VPSLLSIIGEAWDFCRRQQTITHIGFWFIFLPSLGSLFLTDLELHYKEAIELRPELQIALVIGYLAVVLVIMWGMVCTLSVGKRLLQAKAGRSRTSFKAVRQQSRASFLPFVLTSILRGVLTFLWGILLIIPGIVYFVQTAFFPVIVVCEGIAYRPALNRSREITRGQFWNVFLALLGTTLLTLIPALVLSSIFSYIAIGAPWQIILSADVASAILESIGMIMYLLSLIKLYAWFSPAKGPVMN